MLLFSILLCSIYFPINCNTYSLIFDVIFGKGGNIQRVRNIETARSLNRFSILDFIGLVERHGYPAEEHVVTTKDGYILKIHRIPGSPSKPKSEGKPAVFMQHGILASSDTFVLMGPKRDLAFLLANAGYDVWIGNVRGNTYSRAHKTLSPDRDSKFWKFSFHEIAVYDVSASIDYILKKTGEKNLTYIGHSMGTTISYVLLSEKPEYNEKIKFNICLSPVASWRHKRTPFFNIVVNSTPLLQKILQKNQINEFFPLSKEGIKTGMAFCSEISILQPFCISLILLISGYDLEQLNTKALPYIFSYFPSGTSVQIMYHFYQNIASGEFQQFDYGGEKNFLTYGQEKPPLYNLKNVQTPVALIYGGGDVISTREDSEELKKLLPNVVTLEKVPHPNFSHLDFIWARNVKSLLNDRILKLMLFFYIILLFYFPLNCRAYSLLFDVMLGKGGNVSRVRNIEEARSSKEFAILDFIGLVERHGYPAEEHVVTTKDRYILKIHRIPGSPSKPKSEGKPAVFMQHGLLASSDTFVLMGPNRDLAFLLANAGYDVWIGNVRGNTYSRAHKTLSPDRNPQFWKYSFHEIALYDVAASIDYILDKTGEQNLTYIGHSMGTTMSLILLSTKPEYNEKIKFNICLSPIAFWQHKPTPFLQSIIKSVPVVKKILEKKQIYELFPLSKAGIKSGTSLCSKVSQLQPICVKILTLLSGYNLDQLNKNSLPYILSYAPAGTSIHLVYHFYQIIKSGDLRQFDYGRAKNLVIYGQYKPPLYNFQNIKIPVALIYGGGDVLSTKEDSEELKKHLPNVFTLEKVSDPKFTHLDFLWAKNVKSLLNDRVMYLMTQYETRGLDAYE
ncbi:uncharacterized protein LOC127281249 [Leptopilina boulardi]|uniref:uncharacterized protein LOC127281249 n=1 Tax=Leptopilina boulardi TaxID=63433 RepID=UPI0021F56539|nr:uncharacterized protein LOC127281249 [Leptopilina boulardi]